MCLRLQRLYVSMRAYAESRNAELLSMNCDKDTVRSPLRVSLPASLPVAIAVCPLALVPKRQCCR